MWVAQSCLTLCDPMCYSLLGSSVHGLLQARILEWGSLLQGFFSTRDQTQVICTADGLFTVWVPREAPVYLSPFLSVSPFSFLLHPLCHILISSRRKHSEFIGVCRRHISANSGRALEAQSLRYCCCNFKWGIDKRNLKILSQQRLPLKLIFSWQNTSFLIRSWLLLCSFSFHFFLKRMFNSLQEMDKVREKAYQQCSKYQHIKTTYLWS